MYCTPKVRHKTFGVHFVSILSGFPPSSGKSIRTNSFSQYSLGSTAVLPRKYQSTDWEVLEYCQGSTDATSNRPIKAMKLS